AHPGRRAGAVRGAARRGTRAACGLGVGSDLPGVQRRLFGHRRRRLDAAEPVRGRAAPGPDPGRADAEGAGSVRPGRADGSPGLAFGSAHRPGRPADPAARSGPLALGPAADPARPGRAGARGATGRFRRPLRAAGGHRRLPRARGDRAGHAVGAHRHAVPALGRTHAFAGGRTQPRGRGVDGVRPGSGAAAGRGADAGA
ncbi:hypothetical protein CATMIT_01954, partial [Catenibacterium mitsuokai DSM 15897]